MNTWKALFLSWIMKIIMWIKNLSLVKIEARNDVKNRLLRCILYLMLEYWVFVRAFLSLKYYNVIPAPFLMNVQLLFIYWKKKLQGRILHTYKQKDIPFYATRINQEQLAKDKFLKTDKKETSNTCSLCNSKKRAPFLESFHAYFCSPIAYCSFHLFSHFCFCKEDIVCVCFCICEWKG